MKVSLLRNFASPLIALATIAIGGAAQAATFSIESSSQGWFNQLGVDNGEPNDIGNTFTGTFGSSEFRSFFTFDVSGLQAPIKGGTLRLFQETYFSGDPTETLVAYDVSASNEFLTSNPPLVEGLGVFEDLGSGSVYGEGTVEAFVSPTDGFLEITLSAAAVDAINAAQQGTGDFALGLVLASLGGRQSEEGAEAVRFSNPVDSSGGPAMLVVHQVQAVPEPFTLLGLSAVAVGAVFLKRPNE